MIVVKGLDYLARVGTAETDLIAPKLGAAGASHHPISGSRGMALGGSISL